MDVGTILEMIGVNRYIIFIKYYYMISITERLNAIDCKKEDTEELYSIFNCVDGYSLPIIRVELPHSSTFVRQRPNLCVGVYDSIHELLYPPYMVTGYGRANIPYNPMFYCCTCSKSVANKEALLLGTSLFETSEFARDIMGNGIERLTASIWSCNRALSLVAIPFSDTLISPCSEIRYVQKQWKSMLKNIEVSSDGLELIEYMSEEIIRKLDGCEYFKISNFVYWLLYHNGKTCDADGIIYPSMRAQGECFNIALKPSVVDEAMSIRDVVVCQVSKRMLDTKIRITQYGRMMGQKLEFIPKEFCEDEIRFFEMFDLGLNSLVEL